MSDTLVVEHSAGQFTGEVNMLSGRRSLVQARAIEASEVIELDQEHLLSLVQTDSEISEIVLRAFILRRVALIANSVSDVVLLGSAHCAGTLRVREFLTRNGHPYTLVDLDHDEGVEVLLDRFKVSAADVPVLIWRGEHRPSQSHQSADCRLPGLQSGGRPDEGPRRARPRCRTGGTRRRGLWRHPKVWTC